jgi:hypothetical protein
MSNPRFSLNDCSAIQRQVRVTADAISGISPDRAYDIANRALEKLFQERHPTPAPRKPKAEKVTPRVPCTVHREKSFKFSDGTVIQCCSHDDCGWGRTRKTHTDGMTGGTLYAIELPDAVATEVEVTEVEDDAQQDAVEELSVEAWASASPTEDEDGNVIELQSEQEEDDDATGDEATWYEELESCE